MNEATMHQLPLLHEPPPFCAYAGGPCDQDFTSLTHGRGMFVYPSEPKQIAAAIEAAVAILGERTAERWTTWRDMNIAGRVVFCEICKSMRGAETIYADVTTLNFNLLFEIGFGIGLGIPVKPIRDTTYLKDRKPFDALGVLETLGYIDFTNSEQLATAVLEAGPSAPVGYPPIRTYRETPLYVLKGPHDTDGAIRLLSLIKKSRIGFRAYDPVETPTLAFHTARKQVAGSFGVIAHLLSPHRSGALVHNALCAFICGMAVAEQKPVLMLQEETVQQPIDYRDLVQTYATPDQIDTIIQEPLTQVVEQLQRHPGASHSATRTFLTDIDLGDLAAENEIQGLHDYFVPTGRFVQLTQGHARLVVGRKGTGKTAMFYALRDAVQQGRETLVLDMTPEGHQFTRLREAILEELTQGQQEYTIAAFWTYLLSAEVAHKILNSPAELRAAERDPNDFEAYKALEDAYLAHGLASADDLSQRLLRQIDRMAERFGSKAELTARTDLTELVYGGDIKTLNDAVAEYLVRQKEEVWLLIDNLDKSWATRGTTAADMLIMRGLLDASQRLQRQLDRRDVSFRSVVFVRTDVYEHLIEQTPDRGKDTLVRLDWDDAELFREIIRKRVVTSTEIEGDFEDVWKHFAPPLVGIEDAFSYLLERTLMRPRDLLMFLGGAVQVAIDRNHGQITAEDIRQAETGYSEDMLLWLTFEMEDTHVGIANALYSFHGAPATMRRSDLEARLRNAGVDPPVVQEAIELLFWYGFLGIRRATSSEDQYSHAIRYNVDRLVHALDTGQGSAVVHPAFRKALGIDWPR